MGEFNRSRGQKAKKSRVLKLSLFTLNLYFLYLLFSASWILTSVKYFLAITFVFFILDIISKSKAKAKHFPQRASSFIDFFRLSKKYFKINRKYVLVSTLGLILATIMISQTILTSSSYKQNNLENFLDSQNSNAFEIGLYRFDGDFQTQDSIRNQIGFIEETVKSLLADSILDFDYATTLISTDIRVNRGPPLVNPDGFRFLEMEYFTMYVWNDQFASVLETFPTFNGSADQNSSLFIIDRFSKDQDTSIITNNSISLVVGNDFREPGETTPFHFVNQTIDRTWEPTDNDMKFLYSDDNWRVGRFIRNSFIVPETTYFDILQKQKDLVIANNLEHYAESFVQYDVNIATPDLSTTSIDELIFKLNQMANSIRSALRSQFFFQGADVYSPLADSLDQYRWQQGAFGVALIMVSLPLIGVSLFLVYFSLTLVEKRKSKIIAIMKIRGSSKEQLRLMQFAEILVAGTIAAVVGMILSIPWVLITFRVSDFFEFNAEPIDLAIPSSWYWRLPLIAIILTIDLNINSLVTLSDTRIDEGEDVEEKKPPFWQRLYLDLVLFSLSVGVLVFVRSFPISDQSLFYFLLFGIAPWALMIILITAPLVVSRYFSTVISFISDFLWRVQGGMLALATRNMRKNRFSSSRLTALLTLGMMLSFVSIIVPSSFIAYEIENTNYSVGADVYISNLDINNQTLLDLTDVAGIKSRTEIVRAGINLFDDSNYGYRGNIGFYQFMGVNTTTFADTAYWRDSYADLDLGKILSEISYGTVGASDKQLSALGIKRGGIVPNLPRNVSDVSVSVTFDYFPNLVSYDPVDYGDYFDAWQVEFLADIDYVKTLVNVSTSYTTGVYLKLEEGANKTQVDELLGKNFEDFNQIQIRSVNDELYDIQDTDEFNIVLSSFQSMLIITVLISIIAVSYFTFITLSERNKEIGTLRAIGMVKNQIFVLLIVEAMIMLVSGIIFGALTGWFISSYFFYIISNPGIGGIIPPQTLFIPWRLTFGFLGVMFLSTAIASGFPAHRIASKQTGNVLRAE